MILWRVAEGEEHVRAHEGIDSRKFAGKKRYLKNECAQRFRLEWHKEMHQNVCRRSFCYQDDGVAALSIDGSNGISDRIAMNFLDG